jgi:Fe-S-cluster containining protein
LRRIPLDVAAVRAIDALYDSLPKLVCKRLCQGCCGPIEMAKMEYQRIANRLGRIPPGVDHKTLTCPMLKNGGCKVYDIRPMLCRLWGLIDDPLMRCGFGCVPERWLTREESFELLAKVHELGRMPA